MIHSYNVILLSHSGGGGGGLVSKLYLTLATPWTVACQAPLSMGFSRQEYWSGLPFKAMIFPVVMYGYERWTVRKAEH